MWSMRPPLSTKSCDKESLPFNLWKNITCILLYVLFRWFEPTLYNVSGWKITCRDQDGKCVRLRKCSMAQFWSFLCIFSFKVPVNCPKCPENNFVISLCCYFFLQKKPQQNNNNNNNNKIAVIVISQTISLVSQKRLSSEAGISLFIRFNHTIW